MIGAIVDTHALGQVIWVSILSGVGVTGAYGLAILGATRALEFGRDGRIAEATLYAVVGIVGIAVFIVSIVFGIIVLTGD